MKKRLFVDMDGTLARFHDENSYLNRMYEPEFFLKLQPFKKVVDSIKLFIRCNPHIEVVILSSLIDSPYCALEKKAWLKHYLPEVKEIILVPAGEDKADYVGDLTSLDVLLDDYNKNLNSWRRAGGRSVKLVNNINHKGMVGKKWEGDCIKHDDFPFAICHKLNEYYKYAQMDFAEVMALNPA